MGINIRHFRELDVYKLAMDAAMLIFDRISHPEHRTIRTIREEEAGYA